MTTLQGGSLDPRVVRNRPPRNARTGITGSLGAPGLAVPDMPPLLQPNSPGARMAAELMQALGMAGDAIGALGQVTDQERARREIEDRKLEVADEGLAAQHISEHSPAWLEQIERGDVHVPDGVEPLEYSREWVNSLIPPGMSEAYNKEFAKRAVPWFTAKLIEKRNKDIEAQKPHAIQNQVDRLIGQTDPAEFAKSEAFLVDNFKLLPEEAREALGLGAMAGAIAMVQAGASPQLAQQYFDAAAAYLGPDLYKEEQALARQNLGKVIEGFQHEAHEVIADRLDTLLLEFRRGKRSLDSVQRELDDIAPGTLPADSLLRYQNTIDAWRDEMKREALAVEVDRQKAQFEHQYMQEARSLAWNLGLGGGLAHLQDREYQLPNGNTFTMRAGPVKQAIVDDEMSRIAQAYKDDPALAFKVQVDFVARNGVPPTEWSARLNAAPLQAAIEGLIVPTNDNQHPTIPAELDAALQLYAELDAANRFVADLIVKESQARDIYHLAAVASILPGREPLKREDGTWDYSRPLLAAVRSVSSRTPLTKLDDHLPPKLIIEAAQELGGNNNYYVEQQLELFARAYRTIDGVSWERAVEQAVRTFSSKRHLSNGNWVDLNGEIPLRDFDFAARLAAEQYLSVVNAPPTPTSGGGATQEEIKSSPELGHLVPLHPPDMPKGPKIEPNEAAEVEDLALMSDGPGRWRLVNAALNNQDVDNPNVPGLSHFTTAKLIALIKSHTEAQKLKTEAALEQLRRKTEAGVGRMERRNLRVLQQNLGLPSELPIDPQ